MKKVFIYLFVIAFVFAAMASYASDSSSKTATATQGDTVKVDMSGSGCPMMKAQQTDAKDKPAAACPMMKGKADASAATTAASVGDAKNAEAPQTTATGINLQEKGTGATASEVSVEGSTVIGKSAITASGKVEEVCPDVTGKKQLENFHNVMSPMHEALGEKKYDTMRSSVPKLVEVANGLKSAQCPMGDKCPPECKNNYEAKKANLLKAVDEVEVTSKATDNAKFEEAFMTMHSAYIDFATACNMPKETKAKATETVKEIETK